MTKPRAKKPGSMVLAERPRVSMSLPVSEGMALLMKSTPFGQAFLSGWSSMFNNTAIGEAPELQDPYQSEAFVIACVDFLANTASPCKLRIWDRDPDDEDAEEITEGPVRELFNRVSEYMSPAQLRLHDALNITLTGDSVWFLRDKSGQPMQGIGAGPSALIDLPHDIVPVRGDLVSLIPDRVTGVPAAWAVSTAAGRREWPAASVVVLWEMPDPDPARAFRGLGRVAKAWGPAAQNYLARRYQQHLLKNNGEPGGWMAIDGVPVGGPEWKLMEEELSREYGDNANAGKWHLVEGRAKPIPNRTTPKDMEYGALLQANKEDICAVMGTPGGLLGQDQENYATFAGRMRVYLAGRVVPYLRAVADIINRQFFARLRDGTFRQYQCRFDTEEVEQAFRDIGEMADRVQRARDAGFPLDQAIRLAGIKADPIPGGDVAMVPAGHEPLELVILKAKAQTALMLQQAGVPGQKSLDLAKIEATFEEIELDVPIDADASGDPAAPAAIDAATGKPKRTSDTGALADTALNGAQVTSALLIVQEVVAGRLPRESAASMLIAFFNLSPEEAAAVLGTIGAGFEPTPEPQPVAPVPPEGGGPPPAPKADDQAKAEQAKAALARARTVLFAVRVASEPVVTELQVRAALAGLAHKSIASGGVPRAGDSAAGGSPNQALRGAAAALPGAMTKDKLATAGERVRAWRRLQKLQKATRDSMNTRIRKVFYAERRAQLALLEQFAETGDASRAAPYAFRGCDAAPTADRLAVYAVRAPTIPLASLAALAKAIAEDRAEELELRRSAPEKLAVVIERSCCGEELKRTVRHQPRQERWLKRYPWVVAAGGLARARDLVLLQRVGLTESEIDQLIVAADEKWAEAIAGKLKPLTVAQYERAARDLAEELGVSVIDAKDPEVLRRIAARAVKVAEGTQSQLATRLRSELLEAMADNPTVGTLQDRVRAILGELKAGTTRAFNSHASRALAIARTETGIATNNARFDQMSKDFKDGIIAGLRWITSGRGPESSGGTVRDSHFVLEGVTTIPGTPFITGLGNTALHPQDPSLPPEDVVNCECQIGQVVAPA